MYITSLCLYCNKEFQAPKKEIRRGNGKFCSLKCSGLSKKGIIKNKPNQTCPICDNKFYRNENRRKQSKSGIIFCSRKCKDRAQRINTSQSIKEIMPKHFGTAIEGKSTIYRRVCFEHYDKKCNRCGYNKIPEIIQVHHIDRNRLNNSIENLEPLCPTCHIEDHYINGDGLYSKMVVKPAEIESA